MTEFDYPDLGEKIYKETLPNGLRIISIPKNGFKSCFAVIFVNFGSSCESFALGDDIVTLPSGTAHFLEHMLFSGEDRSKYDEFSLLGANANAYTASDLTCFYFDCEINFYESLELMLKTVSAPHFSETNVKFERDIINQEISALNDDPDYILTELLMKKLFPCSRISYPVTGSTDSIMSITAETLRKAHSSFYTPENIVLCTAGDIDITKVIEISSKLHFPKASISPVVDLHTENTWADEHVKADISAPVFSIGSCSKLCCNHRQQYRAQVSIQLVLSCLFGASSDFYNKLYSYGLLNAYDPPSAELQFDTIIISMSGESKQSKKVLELFKQCVSNCDIIITDEIWERTKKTAYGYLVRSLDSFEDECISIAESNVNNAEFMDTFEIIKTISKDDAVELMKSHFPENSFSMVCINPESED